MSFSGQDERLVSHILANYGLVTRRLTTEEMVVPTPDFKVFQDDQFKFFCEVKTIEDEEFDGVIEDRTYDRIGDKLHEAVGQFNSVNSERHYPNVLAYVNHDHQANYQDMELAFEGFVFPSGNRLTFLRSVVAYRLKDERKEIDLVIWINPDQSMYLAFYGASPFVKDLCIMFNMAHLFSFDEEI
jgi:hypothetical protein